MMKSRSPKAQTESAEGNDVHKILGHQNRAGSWPENQLPPAKKLEFGALTLPWISRDKIGRIWAADLETGLDVGTPWD